MFHFNPWVERSTRDYNQGQCWFLYLPKTEQTTAPEKQHKFEKEEE